MSTKTFLWLLGGLVVVGGGTAVYLAMRKPDETGGGFLPENGKTSLPPKHEETPEERSARAIREMADAAARLVQKINPYAGGTV